MLSHLQKNVADLVQNAIPLHDLFLTVRGELSEDLLGVLLPTTFIEGFTPRVIRAKQRLADREAQDNLDAREEATKQEMVELKELIDNLKSVPP